MIDSRAPWHLQLTGQSSIVDKDLTLSFRVKIDNTNLDGYCAVPKADLKTFCLSVVSAFTENVIIQLFHHLCGLS